MDLIEKNYEKLNENDIYVWQYICHHMQEVSQMSVYELAKVCNISHTSIIRFAKKLGLDGFGELKLSIKWNLNQKQGFDGGRSKALMQEVHDFMNTAEKNEYDEIIHALASSRRIYVYGTGQMLHLAAQELKRAFLHCHKIINVVEDAAELDYLMYQIAADDYFIILSVSGNNEHAATLAKVLHRFGSKSLGIASGSKNMLASFCTHYISVASAVLTTGYADAEYHCSLPYYIVIHMMFLKYLEYTS